MGSTLNEVEEACRRLRHAQQSILGSTSQAEIVSVLSSWAERWRDPLSSWRHDAEALTDPFPFTMTRVSLDALLHSLTETSLWALIDSERVRDRRGSSLIGHVIAGNTPLLAWTSVLRAMLMRSASFVKLPTKGAGDWARLFLRSLAEITPALASCVHLAQWPGGTRELDTALCRHVDLILAYGSQDTIRSTQSYCPACVGFIGYGHRVSFGIVPRASHTGEAAHGFARDILLYDQGGCLSPHAIFVEGDSSAVSQFAARLAHSLSEESLHYPEPFRSALVTSRVQEARALARMDAGAVSWEDRHLRWTVIAREDRSFTLSPTHGVVSVQPLSGTDSLAEALSPVLGHLQGCAVAPGSDAADGKPWRDVVERLGVSWICRPGQLQAPPFSWREDSRDVLRCLLPAAGESGRQNEHHDQPPCFSLS